MQEEALASLQRPKRSAHLTPPSGNEHSTAWPNLFEVLETPERKRASNQLASIRQRSENQMDWSTSFSSTTHDLNEDSGLGESFFDQVEEKRMILRPSPVLRTPFVTNTRNLQSPLRSFFFKPSPPTEDNKTSSLKKTENAIGVRFNGTHLIHLKSPCLLSTIQNQNAPPTSNDISTSLDHHKRTANQRSPLKPCQASTRNLSDDFNPSRFGVETPSKGVKVEFGFDSLCPFMSPMKFDSFAPYQSNGFLDTGSVDTFDNYFGTPMDSSSFLDQHQSPLKNNSSPSKSFKNEASSLSSFSLSLNSTNESFNTTGSSLDLPGSMSCSKAIRIKVPRFSSRVKSLIYGRTSAQREITRQANHYWRRNCPAGYQTGILLVNSVDEFSKIDFKIRSGRKSPTYR